jgi:hypothetical protein
MMDLETRKMLESLLAELKLKESVLEPGSDMQVWLKAQIESLVSILVIAKNLTTMVTITTIETEMVQTVAK